MKAGREDVSDAMNKYSSSPSVKSDPQDLNTYRRILFISSVTYNYNSIINIMVILSYYLPFLCIHIHIYVASHGEQNCCYFCRQQISDIKTSVVPEVYSSSLHAVTSPTSRLLISVFVSMSFKYVLC